MRRFSMSTLGLPLYPELSRSTPESVVGLIKNLIFLFPLSTTPYTSKYNKNRINFKIISTPIFINLLFKILMEVATLVSNREYVCLM